MRAGKLDRLVMIERAATSVDSYGEPVDTWSTIGSLRAEVVEAGTEEFLRDYGASSETAIVFRTRFMDGLTLADRLLYAGGTFNILALKEIGRRRGLEIRAIRREAS